MTLEEFVKSIGGKHATIMVCQADGSPFCGHTYKMGDMVNVTRAAAYALSKQKIKGAKKGDPDRPRWIASDATMTTGEMNLMNQHFEKEFETESGEKPIKIKKHKK